MHPQIASALIAAAASLAAAIISALVTLRVTRAKPFLTSRKRNIKGTWRGTAEEIQAFGSPPDRLAKYQVTFELSQFRSRVTGTIHAESDDGNSFDDKIDGRLTTEQDFCFTFVATDENVHDFGAAVFHIHPDSRQMTGYVLSNESSSPGGRTFVMRARMTRKS